LWHSQNLNATDVMVPNAGAELVMGHLCSGSENRKAAIGGAKGRPSFEVFVVPAVEIEPSWTA